MQHSALSSSTYDSTFARDVVAPVEVVVGTYLQIQRIIATTTTRVAAVLPPAFFHFRTLESKKRHSVARSLAYMYIYKQANTHTNTHTLSLWSLLTRSLCVSCRCRHICIWNTYYVANCCLSLTQADAPSAQSRNRVYVYVCSCSCLCGSLVFYLFK